MSINLTPSEKAMLRELRSLDTSSIIRLRSALNWDLARFASTLIALEERGLVVRSDTKIKLSIDGIAYLSTSTRVLCTDQVTPYLGQVEAPRLHVTSLYLPDYRRFLRAQQRNLYTTKVSLDSPE